MTIARGASSSALVALGVIFLIVANWWGSPLRIVGWAGPAIGVAAWVLVIRDSVAGDRGRDALALIAAAGFAVAGIVGGYAVYSLLSYLWGSLGPAPVQATPFAKLGRFSDAASTAWRDHPVSISWWAAVTLLPTLAALRLAVPIVKRLVVGSREVENGPFKAAWMSAARLRELVRNQEGMPLGLLNGAICRFVANPLRGWKGGHSLVISGTRGGKGVSAVNPAIIDHVGPVAVVDIKGELWAMTHRHRASLGRKVMLLDPFGITDGVGNHFNPLTFIRDDPRHRAGDIAVIAEGLVRSETGNGEHFADHARNLVEAAIETVMRLEYPENQNLATVSAVLFGSDRERLLEDWRDSPSQVGTDVSQTAAMLLGLGDKEQGGFFSTLHRGFKWAASDTMRNFLSCSDFSLDDFFEDSVDLYIAIPLHQLGAQAVFMRLMVNLLLATVMREAGCRRLPRNVLLVLDEFTRMGKMEKILDIATAANGLGLDALFVVQNKAQVDDIYGTNGASTLLSACSTIRAWNLGRGDSMTAEWLSSLLGEKTVEVASRGKRKPGRDSRSEHSIKFMSPSDILQMKQNDMLVLFDGQPPAMMKRIISYRDKRYSAKLDSNPTLQNGI